MADDNHEVDPFAAVVEPPRKRGRKPKAAAVLPDDFAGRDRAGKLECLSELALDDLYRVLTMKPGQKGKDAETIETRKERARKEVLTLQARVDSAKLQEKVRDRLADLLDAIKAEGGKQRTVRSLDALAKPLNGYDPFG